MKTDLTHLNHRYNKLRKWFTNAQDKDRYHYQVMFTTKVKPTELSVAEYGHHRSSGYIEGVRQWAFKSNEGYLKAIEKYKDEIYQP